MNAIEMQATGKKEANVICIKVKTNLIIFWPDLEWFETFQKSRNHWLISHTVIRLAIAEIEENGHNPSVDSQDSLR